MPGMKLRRTSGCACVRIGLAAVVLGIGGSPTALAASEDPKPGALWREFPLEPAPGSAATPQPPVHDRPAAALLPPTTATSAPSQASGGRPSAFLLASSALFVTAVFVLLATVAALSGRRLYVWRHERGRSLPPWQDATWPQVSDRADYRWAYRAEDRMQPSTDLGVMIRRVRRAVWNEDTAPVIFGCAAAVVLGVLLAHLIG